MVGQPYIENGLNLSITASVGIVVTRDGNAEPGKLLQDADVAMYEAKEAGRTASRSSRRRSAPGEQRTIRSRASCGRRLTRRDCSSSTSRLISIVDSSLCGVEALVRWDHPDRGVVPPIEFIPLAEQRGLITLIDSFVLEEACRQLAEWLAEGD